MTEIITDQILNPNRQLAIYQQCEEVTDFSEARSIVEEMQIILEEKNALGVAANQLGYLKQIFIVATEGKGIKIFINPVVMDKSEDTELFEEGCLSFPDFYVKVRRSKKIQIQYQDIEGEKHVEIFDGLFSRIIQHELDHLAGRRFWDGVSRIRFDQSLKKLIKKRNLTKV